MAATLEQFLGIDGDPTLLGPDGEPVGSGDGAPIDRTGLPPAQTEGAATSTTSDDGYVPPEIDATVEEPGSTPKSGIPTTIQNPDGSTTIDGGYMGGSTIGKIRPDGSMTYTPPGHAAPPAPAPPAAPTPPSTDYSRLNDLLTQLMAGQGAKTAGNTDFRNNIKSTILSLIKSGSAPVDQNDPTITSATQAFRGEGERALALLREKQAEASRAGGRTAGSEESAMKGGYEDLGNAIGKYRADLQIQELNARRQQLVQAASLGMGVSNADETNSLQAQIAQIDAQLKELQLTSNEGIARAGLTNQNTQFYDNLASQMGNQTNTLDELLSQYLLGGGA